VVSVDHRNLSDSPYGEALTEYRQAMAEATSTVVTPYAVLGLPVLMTAMT